MSDKTETPVPEKPGSVAESTGIQKNSSGMALDPGQPGPGANPLPAVSGAFAFASAAALRVGELCRRVAQDPMSLTCLQPIPGLEKETETLAQRVVRAYLFKKTFVRTRRDSSRGHRVSAPSLGVLKLFLDRPEVSMQDKALVSLVALAMGSVLGEKEVPAQKAWSSMQDQVSRALGSPQALDAAWREIGHVFRRAASGAYFDGPSLTRVDPARLDETKRTTPVTRKMDEVLTALVCSRNPICFPVVSPVHVSKMFSAWAPAFNAEEHPGLARHVLRHMADFPSFSEPSRPYVDSTAAHRLFQALQADQECVLGVMVSMVLCGDRLELREPLTQAIVKWEQGLEDFDNPELVSHARTALDTAFEAGSVHPELKRVRAQWPGRDMDRAIPSAPESTSLPSKPRM